MKPTYRTFKIDVTDQTNLENFFKFVNDKYPFKDTYQTQRSLTIKKHYHEGPEARLFLEGRATFVLEDGVINCEEGTYIEIDPGLVHSFYSEGPFKAIRFNQAYEDWRAIDVD